MSTTPNSPAREAVEQTVDDLMKLAEDFVLHRVGWETLPGHAEIDTAERFEENAFKAEAALRNALTALLAAKQEELDKMREALKDLLGGVGECLTSQGVRVIDCPVGVKARQMLYPDAALSPIQGASK